MSAPTNEHVARGRLADVPDDRLLVMLQDAIKSEKALKKQLTQAKEVTRELIQEGWDRQDGKSSSTSTMGWHDIETATGLTRSALRSRVQPYEAGRSALRRPVVEARDRARNPGRFDAATCVAVARMMGVSEATVRRRYRRNKDGLVPAPEGGWPDTP
jgi:hypothetical protein